MKIALVHDYINEFGGAERVLKVLSEMYPEAPIYTAFRKKGSTADKEFKGKDIRESWLAPILKIGKLYSPLRFLTPLIWKTMDLSEYDIVITSASWYITRGFKVSPKTKVICYCHTPPRWLYGYETSVGFKKWWPVRAYAAVVGHFLRLYDFNSAQPTSPRIRGSGNSGVDIFIANSENVRKRIEKFYRRDAKVIYPPVEVEAIMKSIPILHSIGKYKAEKVDSHSTRHSEFISESDDNEILNLVRDDMVEKDLDNKRDYFLIVSRLVGAKGLEEAVKAFRGSEYTLKIVGEKHGFSDVEKNLQKLADGNIELMGRVDDKRLWELYAGAKGFIALARDEDFGMTIVEAQAAGVPVIAFNGGGFKESVNDGKTGILIDNADARTIRKAIEKLLNTRWNKKEIQKNAKRFSKKRFDKEISKLVSEIY